MNLRGIMKKVSFLAIFAIFVLMTNSSAWGQVTLGTSPFVETFDSVGSGLPTGFTVRTGASATTLGTVATFNTAPVAFSSTTGQFANYASSQGLTSTSTATEQNNLTDRVIGLRQTGAFGDPGAAFVLELSNTSSKSGFMLTFEFQTLSVQTRDTTFTVDYGFGATPTTFTPVTTVNSGNTFGSQTVTANFGTALDNQSGPVFIRIVALTASTGTGSRDTVAIDDFRLTFLVPSAAPANISGRVTNGLRGISKARIMISGGDLTEPRYARTNGFGYYTFEDLTAGETYILEVSAKQYRFSNPTLVVNLQENLAETNFIGEMIQNGAK